MSALSCCQRGRTVVRCGDSCSRGRERLSGGEGALRAAGIDEPGNPHDRRWVRVVERGMPRVGRQRARVFAIQVDQRAAQFRTVAEAGGEGVGLEFVAALTVRLSMPLFLGK